MKINPFKPTEMNPYNRQVNKTGQKPNIKQTDKVEISSVAKEMQQTPDIVKERMARIEELKIQVQNGQYQVDPKTVAEGIAKFYQR